MKNNWYRSFRDLAINSDFCELLSLDELYSEDLSYEGSYQIVRKLISQIQCKLEQSDILKMQCSKSMRLYKNIRSHVRIEPFMMLKTSWVSVTVIIQLRSNLSKIINTNLRELAFFYNQCENDECQNCTLNVTENCFHVMFVCPKYKLLRHHFLKCYNLPQTLARYYDYFEEMDSEKVKLIYNYVRCMLNIRVT
jgi:hypothetical protein